jgi:biotin carboxyl carrier protein
MSILIRALLLLALVGGLGYGGYKLFESLPQRQQQVATTAVKQGDVIVRSYARGELRAVRSATLTAPNLFGTVQVTKLAALGAFAREKDLIVEFDDADVISRLEEQQLELDQIDEQIKKSEADLSIRNNQDQVELLRAQFAVRRAELEVKRNELLSSIDQKKNLLTLDEARRRLKQLESDIRSRQEQARAELAVLEERRNKSVLQLAREKARLGQVKVLSPMSGLVAVKQNRSSAMMFGMQLPDIREGDQIQPGIPVAEILDLSELEVVAKVGELDRANLREGQPVEMRLDASPDKKFHGQIKSMSATASANMFSSDPAKKFDVLFSIDMKELLSTLGAKPEYIAQVLATAEANRRRGPMPGMGGGGMLARMGGGAGQEMGGGGMLTMGGPGAGGFAPAGGGFGGEAQGGAAGQGGGRRAGGAGGGQGGSQGGGGNMLAGMTRDLPEAQQKQVRAAYNKLLGGKTLQELDPEDRKKMMASLRDEYKKITGKEMQMGGGRQGGPGGAGGGRNRQDPNVLAAALASGPFSAKDLESAKLPPPPEEDSQIDVLLRPGLLTDVEIIVEKIPNAIYLPVQAVFDRDGKMVVFVRGKDSKFEQRIIRPMKRSENLMVIAEGVKPNDIVALADPFAKPGDKKKKGEGGGSGAPAGLPMGGKGSR